MIKRLLTAFTLAVLTIWWAQPAFAHAQLVSSEPAVGAILRTPPTSVTITFDDDLIDIGGGTNNVIQVTNEAGVRFDVGATTLSGAAVSVAVSALDLGHTYTVTYSVVSADGHPVSHSYQFEILGAPGPSSASPATEPSKSATVTKPKTTARSTASPELSGSSQAADNRGGGLVGSNTSQEISQQTQIWIFVSLAGLFVILLAAVVAFIWLRNRDKQNDK